jgi:cytoskeletal protein RodZ
MTRRVVTCNSWREAAADECDEFFTKLIGWAVLIALGFGALTLFSGKTPSAPSSSNAAPQQPSQPSSPAPAEGSHGSDLAAASLNTTATAPEHTQTCWFVPGSDGSLQPEPCSVSKRINANGDTVYDVINNAGEQQAIVLWDNNAAEVIRHGVVSSGSWSTDNEGDIWIELEDRKFVYPPV